MRYLFMFIILLVSPATRALAQPATLECDPTTLIGMLPGLQTPTTITVEGDYAYIVEDTYTFVIVDLSNPASPQLLARTDIPGPRLPFQITINADAAYLHHDDYPGGIYIYNIEDKADPWFVRAITTPYYFSPTARSDPYLFAEGFAYNIQRPFAPGIDSYFDPDFSFQYNPIFVKGSTLFTSELYQFDISAPLAPVLIDDDYFSDFDDFNIRYEHPYLVDDIDNDGLFSYIFFGENSTRPFTKFIQTNGFTSATLRGGILFAANGTLDVYADSSKPLQIASLGPESGMIDARLIRQLGDNFLITSDDTLAIYSIPTNPISSGNATNIHTYIEMMDDLVFLGAERYSSFFGGVDILDASNPARPIYIDNLNNTIDFYISQGLATKDNQLFVAIESVGLAQFEFNDEAQPTLLATYPTGIDPDDLRPKDIEIRDNLAYVVDQSGKLTVYEFLPDASLSEVASLEIADAPQRITVLDDLAFICSNYTAYLVDISDPLNPTLKSTIDGAAINFPHFLTADRQGDLLYTAENSNGYRIFDISDLSDPFELAHFEADISTPAGDFQAFAYDIELDNNTLYLSMSSGGFAIYDNTNPFNPMLRSHMPATVPQGGNDTRLREFIKRDDTIYIASGEAGLRVLSLSGCSLPCAIDFNNDGALNFYDVTLFIQAYTSENPIADLNSDGQFNFFDVASFLALYNKGCP